jgi:hypothetical protein
MSDNLPIPDYDQQSIGSLEHRMRSLSEDELATVLEHERMHSNRPAVVQMLAERLRRLNQGEAQPSGGSQDGADAPPSARDADGADRAGPQTAREPDRPERHGLPWKSGQPGT